MRLLLLHILFTVVGLGAGEALAVPAPADELPITKVERATGWVDDAGFAWPVSKRGCSEAAVALGAMPELPVDPPAFAHLVATWQPVAPVVGQPVALLVVGPLIEPDRERSRIESVRLTDVGLLVTLSRWSGPLMARNASPMPKRQAWLLQLPALPAGCGTVAVKQHWYAQGEASDQAQRLHSYHGTVTAYAVGANAAGGRSATSLREVITQMAFKEKKSLVGWLPAARSWVHPPVDPGMILAGTGLLGFREVDVEAAAWFARHDAKPEEVLAQGKKRTPCVLINGPELSVGEYSTLRSTVWTAPDTLEVVLAVWYDAEGREQNVIHQDTWLLPIHPATVPSQVHVKLTWEPRSLDQASGWYRHEPGLPHRVPAGAVTGLSGQGATISRPDGGF